ncbi:MAG: MCP four helix bundle domain-containing protein, partial [Acidobacteriota bacterium]
MLSNMKLSSKLIAGFSVVAVITLLVGALGLYGVIRLGTHINQVGEVRLPSVQSLLVVSQAQMDVDSAENALLVKELSAADRQYQYDRIAAAFDRAEKALAIYAPLEQTEEEKKVWEKFRNAWKQWQSDDKTYLQMVKEYTAAPSDAKYQIIVNQALKTNGVSFKEANDPLNELVTINEDVASDSVNTAASDSTFVEWLAIICMLLGALLALLLGVFLGRSIANPMLAAITDLSDASEQVAAASEQLSDAGQQLAQGSAEQAAS